MGCKFYFERGGKRRERKKGTRKFQRIENAKRWKEWRGKSDAYFIRREERKIGGFFRERSATTASGIAEGETCSNVSTVSANFPRPVHGLLAFHASKFREHVRKT